MMWSGPWQQWPLQQSMYQNVPHEQVDWAALAKQWIQLQHVHKTEVRSSDPMPGLPPVMPHVEQEPVSVAAQPLPATTTKVPLLSNPIIIQDVPRIDVISHIEPEGPHGAEHFLHPGSKESGYWHGAPSWEGDSLSNESWATQQPPPAEESFAFGHMHGNQHLQAQSYDYNHGSDHYGYNQDFSSDLPYSQYWTTDHSSSVLPPFIRQDKKLRSSDTLLVNNEQDSIPGGQLDAAKRKTLPAWIREGLEKMERQRQKKMESEKQLSRKPPNVLSFKEEHTPNDMSSRPKSYIDAERSRFESDSEGEDVTVKDANRESSPTVDVKRSDSPMPTHLTDEEKQQELMLRVRKMLTEILLGVTNDEISSVAKEVYQRALSKAPARQLVSSSALASIAGGLGGLADYGSEESEDGGNDDGGDDEDEDSDEELDRKIKEKQKSFAIREKEIMSMLDEEEAAERQKLKAKQEPIEELVAKETSPYNSNSESVEKSAADLKSASSEKQPKPNIKDSTVETRRNASSTSQSPDSDSSSSSGSTSSSSSSRKRKRKSTGLKHKSQENRKSRIRRSSSRDSDRGAQKKSSRKRSRSRDRLRESHRDGRHDSGKSRKNRNRSPSSDRSRSHDRSGQRHRSRSAERRRSSRRRSRSRSIESRNKRGRSRDRRRSRSRDKEAKQRSRSRERDSKYKSKSKSKRRTQSKSPRRNKSKRERSPSPKKSKKRRSCSNSSDSEKSDKKSSSKK